MRSFPQRPGIRKKQIIIPGIFIEGINIGHRHDFNYVGVGTDGTSIPIGYIRADIAKGTDRPGIRIVRIVLSLLGIIGTHHPASRLSCTGCKLFRSQIRIGINPVHPFFILYYQFLEYFLGITLRNITRIGSFRKEMRQIQFFQVWLKDSFLLFGGC